MTAYLSVMNKETGNSPFICEPRQSSLVMEKDNYVLLLSMTPQYAVNIGAGVSH